MKILQFLILVAGIPLLAWVLSRIVGPGLEVILLAVATGSFAQAKVSGAEDNSKIFGYFFLWFFANLFIYSVTIFLGCMLLLSNMKL